MLLLPFRGHLGEPWLYLQLGWGGILGAYFGLKLGAILAVSTTAAGFLLILPWLYIRWNNLSNSWGPMRIIFYLGAIALLVLALILQWAD
ncbi:MAG TPA: hypothetical protein PKA06_12460 [Gemmatales bacterium]|nr:hypothetical protein [Gemmatales bacterium]HMP16817.1 hypothetical protein [Gemmatales bacterium]